MNNEVVTNVCENDDVTKRNARDSWATLIASGIGLLLGAGGVLKLFDFAKFADYYAAGGQPRWMFFGSGIVEVIAALLLTKTRLYAAWSL